MMIGVLLGACTTGEAARKTPGPAAGGFQAGTENRKAAENREATEPAEITGPLRYSRNVEIPLWEEIPQGLESGKSPVLSIGLDLLDTEVLAHGEPAEDLERLFRNTFYRGLSVRDYTEDQIRVQTLEYRDMGEEARHNSWLINSAALNWEYHEIFQTPVHRARLLVVSRERSFYSGGAHPNHDKIYFVFDPEVGMRISLSDVIRNDSLPPLKELINRELRRYKKIGPGDSLKKALFFVDEAEAPENYFFSPQGLGFHWDPYEIASYAEGYVEVFLSYDEIWELLGPEGRRLAREFGDE
jgi:hypothetical protein